MPKSEKAEKLSDFLSRYLGSKHEEKKPNRPQRLALGYAEAKEQAKKERHATR